ncbi:hypothetical protein EMIT091MI3_160048 [Kosakonia quasisacchari]
MAQGTDEQWNQHHPARDFFYCTLDLHIFTCKNHSIFMALALPWNGTTAARMKRG